MHPKQLVAIDTLLSDRVRLAIMATLAATAEPIDFTELLQTLELTRGNLATHLRKLEEGGLILVSKQFVNRKPRTTYACTALGRAEIAVYLEKIEKLLKGVLKS